MAKRKPKAPLPSKETPAPNPVKKEKASRSKGLYWLRPVYVKGAGMAVAGEEVTTAQLKAWNKATPVELGLPYAGKLDEVAKEKPKTDKEKLADYEALKKE